MWHIPEDNQALMTEKALLLLKLAYMTEIFLVSIKNEKVISRQRNHQNLYFVMAMERHWLLLNGNGKALVVAQ